MVSVWATTFLLTLITSSNWLYVQELIEQLWKNNISSPWYYLFDYVLNMYVSFVLLSSMLFVFDIFCLLGYMFVVLLSIAGSTRASYNVSGIEGTGNLLESCDGKVD